ncbi:MAG: hypothetical protein Q8781_00090 [Candidatus Phytoplasma stylosanthis]|uniref:hypothetical protein n=1 Tax=Candidatus Phytoplasma stylosanthis TaxID=2798314 RepID=UPI00293AD1DD|nr:hypothetical protein [Candidatus Phytoplasma stylosanthis]MDV3168068.1 hypothetical protein [Candidatus Phytoplasma stylosanthis]MDV3170694.1 hypothetical protein [Candidatus Phytoplasma stylosanthis]MDV3173677.1 hypothetical protein [Candidatus Phytoplasma stylosanthis]MDV3174334.1 hypothetical protein [Candidatus Phytoplasma stylosanthis]MDV3202675.1 hypothetical protein [Candidatus Phytoplasma stylosanthis]
MINSQVRKKILKISLSLILFLSLFLSIYSYKNKDKDDKNSEYNNILEDELENDISESIKEEFYDIFQKPEKILNLIKFRNDLQNYINEINSFYELVKSSDNFVNSIDSDSISNLDPKIINDKLKENQSLKHKNNILANENKNLEEMIKQIKSESEQNQLILKDTIEKLEDKNNKLMLEIISFKDKD